MLTFLIAFFALAQPLTYSRVEPTEIPNVPQTVASVSTTAPAKIITKEKEESRAVAATSAPKKAAPVAAAPSVAVATPAPSSSVPFYSQFTDIASATWQKVGCGITDLAMIIDYYVNDAPSVETLLAQGIAAGAYDDNAGWTYQGLVDVSKKYGLNGHYYDMKGASDAAALKRLQADLADGPVIASVYYKLEPGNPIPHLIVVSRIEGDTVYYNDPAKKGPAQTSTKQFLAGWKKRVVVIRPEADTLTLAPGVMSQLSSL